MAYHSNLHDKPADRVLTVRMPVVLPNAAQQRTGRSPLKKSFSLPCPIWLRCRYGVLSGFFHVKTSHFLSNRRDQINQADLLVAFKFSEFVTLIHSTDYTEVLISCQRFTDDPTCKRWQPGNVENNFSCISRFRRAPQ